MIKQIITIIVVGLISFCVLSCSSISSNIPVSPKDADDFQFMNDSYIPAPYDLDVNKSRVLWGIWDVAQSDRQGDAPGSARQQAICISPSRELAYHYNITKWIPAPRFVVRAYDQVKKILSLDATISNPYIISGYDVRLIIYTDTLGHKLINADDWTSLYDISGGLPINPFKAFAKSQANRKFDGQTQYTERCNIYLPDGDLHFTIAIDASYPANCDEPYELTNFTQGIILDQLGSSTELEITAHSWANDVNSVKLYCPAITGTALVSFSPIDSEKWGYTLTNNTGAASGNYFGYLIATTSKSGSLALYDEVTIKITPLNSGWARTWGGVGDDEAQDVAVDADGNVYSTGEFKSSVDFNPDPEAEDTHTSNGLSDAFLVKYDKYGNFVWAKTWGGSAGDAGAAIDVDSMGDVYVGGVTDSTPFLVRYSPDGIMEGMIKWAGGGLDTVRRIHVDEQNYVYVTGYFDDTEDFDPSPTNQDMHSAVGNTDVYLVKFDSNGGFRWARTWGSVGNEYGGKGVTVDSYGNVYCSGYFEYTVDFDPSSGINIHTSQGEDDAFLSSFDANGNFRWAHTWGSDVDDEAWECAVDEFDDVYVVGNFYYTVDFNPDPLETEERTAVWESDVFVSKFAPDGDFKWVLTWGGTSLDTGLAISTNYYGQLWVIGTTRGNNIDYDPGPGTDIKGQGRFLSKFDIDGAYAWSRVWRTVALLGNCLDVNSSGQSFFGGWYEYVSQTDFDPGDDIWKPDEYGEGWDCYIIKLLPNGYWE